MRNDALEEELARLATEADRLEATVSALDLRLRAAMRDASVDDAAFLALCDTTEQARRDLWKTWHRIRDLRPGAPA
jgi:hypothetical protein